MKNIILNNNTLQAKISLQPFELVSLTCNKKEYVYQQTDSWKKSWPVCFPITGKLFQGFYYYQGKKYFLNNHGLFREIKDWKIIFQSSNEVVFNYRSNEMFKEIYPFDFELEVSYKLNQKKLINSIRIINHSDNPLPYGFGWHPAFICDKNSGIISFESLQKITNVPIDTFFCSEMTSFVAKDIKLSELDFVNSNSYAALSQTSNSVIIKDLDHEIKLMTSNYENVVIWKNSNNSNFICVEPWMSHQDYCDQNYQDITLKPWIKKLNIREEKKYQLIVEIYK